MKDFKRKLLELWNLGFDAKRIKKYFEDNRETWSDINLSKIEVYYFSKDTKIDSLLLENRWILVLIERK